MVYSAWENMNIPREETQRFRFCALSGEWVSKCFNYNVHPVFLDGRSMHVSREMSQLTCCGRFWGVPTTPDIRTCRIIQYIMICLEFHIKSKHKGVKYSCDHCDFHVNRKDSLNFHTVSKHNGVMYSCNQCDFNLTTHESLQFHIESVHGGGNCSCNQCDF